MAVCLINMTAGCDFGSEKPWIPLQVNDVVMLDPRDPGHPHPGTPKPTWKFSNIFVLIPNYDIFNYLLMAPFPGLSSKTPIPEIFNSKHY